MKRKSAKGEALAFLEKVLKLETDECVLWEFYPSFSTPRIKINGRFEYVAPIVCERVYGPFPGRQTRRTCGTDYCINPRHLEWRAVNPPKPSLGKILRAGKLSFIEYAIAAQTDDCIEWPFSFIRSQWGSRPTISIAGNTEYVERIVCERAYGPPPTPEHMAAHAPIRCHNSLCINHRHLRWATNAENQADRHLDNTMTETPRNRKLTKADVAAIIELGRTNSNACRILRCIAVSHI